MKQTAAEWLFEKLWNTDKDKFTWYAILKQTKEMEIEQKEKVNLLLNTLLENNMCSVAGDELIQTFKSE